jgi:hypothetical protein
MNDPRKRIDKNHRGMKIMGAWMCLDAFCQLVQAAFRFSYSYFDVAVFSAGFVAMGVAAIWVLRR